MNATDLTLKKMFDISAKLVGEQDEISGLDTTPWEKHLWKFLSLIGDETIINLQHAKVYVFSDSVLCLGRGPFNIRSPTKLGKTVQDGSQLIKATETDGINGEPTEFEWNISQYSQRCSSAVKSQIY